MGIVSCVVGIDDKSKISREIKNSSNIQNIGYGINCRSTLKKKNFFKARSLRKKGSNNAQIHVPSTVDSVG